MTMRPFISKIHPSFRNDGPHLCNSSVSRFPKGGKETEGVGRLVALLVSLMVYRL